MNTLFFVVFFCISTILFVTRFLFWLSIWQQKEYRLDRFITYLNDNKKVALLNSLFLIPLSVKSLKRPKFTPKAILIAISSISIILICLYNFADIFVFVAIYLSLPFFIIAVSFPFIIITLLLTVYYQTAAVRLFSEHKPVVIGITGSYGKTTTKLILAQILKSELKTWNSPKSHNTPLSLPKAIVETYKGEKYVVLEFAAYKMGEIKRLASLFPPDMAILTGITHQHEAIFGSFANLIRAKSELPDSLRDGSIFVINNHNKEVVNIASKYPNLSVKTATQSQIKDPDLDKVGRLSFRYKNLIVKTSLIGKHYLSNIEVAIVMAEILGIKPESIKKSLESYLPSPEFISSYKTRSGLNVINDSKSSNPQGFEAAIDLASEIPNYYKVLITPGIIDLGSASDTIHNHLGKKAAQVFDRVIHTSDTGSKQFSKTLAEKYYKISTQESLDLALNGIKPDSLIIIEGRIPHTYHQNIDGYSQ